MPVVTLLYAGLLGLMAIAIAIPAGRLRSITGISVGDGGNPDLVLAMRRHANFVEWVPIALILIGLLEMNGVSANAIHGLGGGLVVFRVCHAFGLKSDDMKTPLRGIGAVGSTLLIAVASVWAIVKFF